MCIFGVSTRQMSLDLQLAIEKGMMVANKTFDKVKGEMNKSSKIFIDRTR